MKLLYAANLKLSAEMKSFNEQCIISLSYPVTRPKYHHVVSIIKSTV